MRASGPNERLRGAMRDAGYSVEALAEATGYHPKQVGRWIARGVVPRRAGAPARIAKLLGKDGGDIWPAVTHLPRANGAAAAEILEVWAHRSDAPKERWWELLSSARRRIDLLAYAMLFLPEDHPGLIDMLADKASAGCRMRIALADPDCQLVADRGAEEGVPLDMRIRYSIRYFAPLADVDGIELHLHQTPLYASVFIADEQVFYTPHLYGLPGPYAPLFHVRQLGDDGIYAGLAGHVERVWEISEPWPGSTTTTTQTPRPLTA